MPLVQGVLGLDGNPIWLDDTGLDAQLIPKVYRRIPEAFDISWVIATGNLFGIGWMPGIDQPVRVRRDRNLYLGDLIPQTFGPFDWKVYIKDSVGMTDAGMPSTSRFLQRIVQDNVGITDVISQVVDFVRSVLDGVGITDSLDRQVDYDRSVSDTVGVTDAGMPSVARRIVVAILADTVGITDASMPAIVRSIGVLLANTVGITDILTKAGVFNKSLADNVGVTDTLIKQANYIRVLTDTVGVTDIVSAYFAAITHYLYARAVNWVLQARGDESS